MNILYLRNLMEIAKCHSINKASSLLYTSPQQLSYNIKSIEEEFHVTIFERTNQGLKITPEGKAFLEEVEILLAQYDGLYRSASDPAPRALQGQLSIYGAGNVWNQSNGALSTFATQYPEISINYSPDSPENILAAIQQKPQVTGLIINLETDGELAYPIPEELEYVHLVRRPLVAYCSRKNTLLQNQKSLSLKKLKTLPLINYKPYLAEDTLLLKIFHSKRSELNIRYNISDVKVFFSLLETGNCFYLGSSIPDHIRNDNLMVFPIRDNIDQIYGIVCHHDYRHEPIHQAFMATFQTYYNALYQHSPL